MNRPLELNIVKSTRFTLINSLLAAVGVTLATLPAFSQAPVIASFNQNGQLVATNLQPWTTAIVEWAPSLSGPWTNSWSGLDAVTVGSNGTIRVSVPMFYRLRGFALVANPPLPTNMALIPAGSFTMGDTWDGDTRALPVHSVYVSEFFMDRTEVTKTLWDTVWSWALTNGYDFDNLGSGKATNHPVHTVTWCDVVKWCNARSEKEGRIPAYYTSAARTTVYRSGQLDVQNDWVNWNEGFRLPTEAEWERAARGGTEGHRFPWSNVETITHSQANYYGHTQPYDLSPTKGFHPAFNDGVMPYTSPVGYFAGNANSYGLYDMAGNVYEWTWDWFQSYPSASQTNPRGSVSGLTRVTRGGCWFCDGHFCTSAWRGDAAPRTLANNMIGFRCVLSPIRP